MRLHRVLLGCGLLLSTVAMGQNGPRQVKGKLELKQLSNDSAFAWFYTGVNKYDVNANMVNYIKTNKEKIKLVALVNTADEASRKLLPEFYKVMILASVPEENIQMYGVDNSGNSGSEAADGYKVKKVPTILVLQNGKEEGRITAGSSGSVEENLAQILMKMNAKRKD
ncbi:hypothetical protein [Chitinophaga alhagiae]|uniref:hypothetical protein n=1 Tax=Chitinophaga alhagiae TaxID=2203219 RepID=UPI0013002770|nr:hypothetical protein [Chitinophaga alhagiae]